MSKEMIDNINVAECEYFFDGKCRCMNFCFEQDFYTCPQCKNIQNCYYKQFKHLQENYETFANKFLNSETDKYLLQEENKKLKQEKTEMKKSFVDIISNIREENYRYYKALKEADALFEVLENIMPTITLPDGNDSPRAIKEARNKINEVLKNE